MLSEGGEDFAGSIRVRCDLHHLVMGHRVTASLSFGLARHGSARVVLPFGGWLFLAALHRNMALEAIDLTKAGAVPRDLIFTEEHASTGDEDRLMAV